MWIAEYDLYPGHPVEVTAADNPPTEPDLAKINVPKGTVKELPREVPEGVPAGGIVVFNSLEHFGRLPDALTAHSATSSRPAAVAQSPAYDVELKLTGESAPRQLAQMVLALCVLQGFDVPDFFPFVSNLIAGVQHSAVNVSYFSRSAYASHPVGTAVTSRSSSRRAAGG